MATAPNLPTDVAPGDPDHAGLHNDVNTSVNTLSQDTGWRRVLTAAQVGNDVIARRIGSTVHLSLDPTGNWVPWHMDESGWGGNFGLPVGLRPAAPVIVEYVAEGNFNMVRINSDGHTNPEVDGDLYGTGYGAYLTDDTFPDPLPGTAYDFTP